MLKIFDECYIWKCYDSLCHLGSEHYDIPDTNYRIKEVAPYQVQVQVMKLYKIKSKDEKEIIKKKWSDVGELYIINPYDAKKWPEIFDDSDVI